VLVGLAINVLLLPLGVVARGAMGAVIASALSYVISAAYFVVVLDREYRLPRASYQVMMATSVAITVSVVVARTMNAWLPAASTRADALLVLGILGSAAVGIFLVAARAMGVFRWSSLSTVVARS
jgi:peptidoglycan biosynthesis protein MviN/MurJ (putative lipid II flippase)